MAEHSIFGGELRPDQQRYAKLMGGMASPLWVPFMAAASMGAAWWMMQNWPRMAAGSAKPAATNGGGDGASAQTPAQQTPAARSLAQEVTAPLTETLAVQGANDAEAAQASAPQVRPAARAAAPEPQASAAPKAKPRIEPDPAPAAAKPKTARKPDDGGQDPAVSKLLAAAADHPEPELPPHEGLPSRKKGKGKKNGG